MQNKYTPVHVHVAVNVQLAVGKKDNECGPGLIPQEEGGGLTGHRPAGRFGYGVNDGTPGGGWRVAAVPFGPVPDTLRVNKSNQCPRPRYQPTQHSRDMAQAALPPDRVTPLDPCQSKCGTNLFGSICWPPLDWNAAVNSAERRRGTALWSDCLDLIQDHYQLLECLKWLE
ncbi:unnamed protein product [Pleuronectes platessa]|uniref:Uncharacterized protein n=1 Tax=Pleuronectes platessa TaxID=8262 RepID=A0A9N7YRZ1_PLEPL|nr:unnamed protein product [Pleuronectes platessa]